MVFFFSLVLLMYVRSKFGLLGFFNDVTLSLSNAVIFAFCPLDSYVVCRTALKNLLFLTILLFNQVSNTSSMLSTLSYWKQSGCW